MTKTNTHEIQVTQTSKIDIIPVQRGVGRAAVGRQKALEASTAELIAEANAILRNAGHVKEADSVDPEEENYQQHLRENPIMDNAEKIQKEQDELDALYYTSDDDSDERISSIEAQSHEFKERLADYDRRKPNDYYETTAIDEDSEEYPLLGMIVRHGRKVQ